MSITTPANTIRGAIFTVFRHFQTIQRIIGKMVFFPEAAEADCRDIHT